MATNENKVMQVVNGITVYGKKTQRQENNFRSPEDSSINFSSTEDGNIGKIAVFLLRCEVFGRILSPLNGDDLGWFLHYGEILYEDEDSFIINQVEILGKVCPKFVMKYPEVYSFFRIVDTGREVEAIRALVENYAERLFETVGGVRPFDVKMLEELEESLEGGCGPGDVSTEEQEAVLAKLRQTKFKPSHLYL